MDQRRIPGAYRVSTRAFTTNGLDCRGSVVLGKICAKAAPAPGALFFPIEFGWQSALAETALYIYSFLLLRYSRYLPFILFWHCMGQL